MFLIILQVFLFYNSQHQCYYFTSSVWVKSVLVDHKFCYLFFTKIIFHFLKKNILYFCSSSSCHFFLFSDMYIFLFILTTSLELTIIGDTKPQVFQTAGGIRLYYNLSHLWFWSCLMYFIFWFYALSHLGC